MLNLSTYGAAEAKPSWVIPVSGTEYRKGDAI